MSDLKLRPAAVPLVTVDPFFSIWSCSDRLNDDYTRHWTGRYNPMFAGLIIDGAYYSLMGKPTSDKSIKRREEPKFIQEAVEVLPLTTVYKFKNELARVSLSFTSPLIPDRPDIMSRTASYISYDIEITDGKKHDVKFVYAISAECAVDSYNQRVVAKKGEFSLYVGNSEQNVLSKTGDLVCIDWGYLHLADTSAVFCNEIYVDRFNKLCYTELLTDTPYNAYGLCPYLLTQKSEASGVITIAYDEIKPIEYFGRQLNEYYMQYYNSFEAMLNACINEYDEVSGLCDIWNKKVLSDGKKYGDKYAYIISLLFRQTLGAHKLCMDEDKNILYLSKECYSNGCIATMDITYPSIPFFLKYNPELILGMLNPIFKYAGSSEWEFDFAPHDVGQYPKANGQVYGDNKLEFQMPVEECGNAIICVAAYTKYSGDSSFASLHKPILKKWADYLAKNGYKPTKQLCTDDFGGHIDESCNLSLKAIISLAAYAKLYGEQSYMDLAQSLAKSWEAEAVGTLASKMAFNIDDSWSIKYNLVWDKLLGFNLFNKSTYDNEIKLYSSKMESYGVPLDSRHSYTKLDWLFWSSILTDDKSYFDKITDCAYKMINETEDRVPTTDWYDASDGKQCEFQNRSVVGGVYINMI